MYVYINSRYIIKRGNQIKSQFKSKLRILKYAFIYLIIFMIISHVLIYIFFDKEKQNEDVFTNLFINPIKYWYHKYFLKVYFNNNNNNNNNNNENVHGHNMWAPMKFIISSNIYVNNYIIKYTPFFITFLFNYFFIINTIIKFYSSLMFSSIIFLFMSYTYFSCNYLLIFIIIILLLFINILGTSSVLLNILLSSYIIIANNHFHIYTFGLTILYFIFHIYLMFPSNNLFQNINYELKICSELIKNLYYFFLNRYPSFI
ncbi:hypothetical protein PFHG_05658 [Plasmodium falciparum HB3]|uniref:Uncharacterized protein n=1 Tax=Plasmodium falciparum (isolate HB3) TaxID=137071 RepID=A0A0L7KDY6_PLAFX|nr:hypothetical protein PFHG_05658 [Plasmodium falciparum HB3]